MKIYEASAVGNYYGTPQVWEKDGLCYFGLDNYDGLRAVSVSREFFEAFVKQFPNAYEIEDGETL
jgi:hypothetical protein